MSNLYNSLTAVVDFIKSCEGSLKGNEDYQNLLNKLKEISNEPPKLSQEQIDAISKNLERFK